MKNKILVNSRCLSAKLTGVQRYLIEILSHSPGVNNVSPDYFARGLTGHLWEQFVLPKIIHKDNILWSPSNTGPLSCRRQVLTLHDVVPLDHPEWLSNNFSNWYRFLVPRLVKNVEKIITISDFSKSRILATTNISEDSIVVIPNGVNNAFFKSKQYSIDQVRNKLKLPSNNYVLSLGSIEPRKNLSTLFKAWEILSNKISDDIWLVVAGGPGSNAIFKDVNFNKIPNRIYFAGHVSDDYLPSLYANSLFFAYLSSYEGFGLPPLEAMAAGSPVITGNLTSLPEVVGSAGILVNPFDVEEISEKMLELVNSHELRIDLIDKGQKQARNFSWEKTAKKTMAVFEGLN
jgi:glycosyltransferase involved in cell wall biosynthesis